MEPYLEELVDKHQLQKGDLLALIDWWTNIHRPNSVEEFIDGSKPVFYAHKNVVMTLKKKGKLK